MRKPPFSTSAFFGVGFGLMSAAASFLILAQIHSSQHPSGSGWYAAAIVLLALGVIMVVWGVAVAITHAREGWGTPLEIRHDPDDPECRQVRSKQGDWQLRVRVRNRGRYGLNHVRARMEVAGGYSHWLRLEHDNAPPFHRSVVEGEILAADDSFCLYFDVGFMNQDGLAILEYADEYLRESSASAEPVDHLITVKVWATRDSDGRTVAPGIAHFRFQTYSEIGVDYTKTGVATRTWPKARLVSA